MAEPSGAGRYALPRDTLLVRGVDRKTWLDGLLTCAVTGVVGGVAGYGLLLTKQGKIVTDVFLLDDGQQLFVGVAPGLGAAVRELLDRYLVMEDAELEESSSPVAWGIATAPLGEADALAQGTLELGTLHARLFLATPPVSALPSSAQLLAEHGLGTFGVDFDQHDNPHEASLDRIAVSWTKGCYLGQEVVCMQDMRGRVKRRLVALDAGPGLLGADVARKDILAADGSVAGHASSVHAAAGGARVLASISAPALESPNQLSVLGEPVRVAFGATTNLG